MLTENSSTNEKFKKTNYLLRHQANDWKVHTHTYM